MVGNDVGASGSAEGSQAGRRKSLEIGGSGGIGSAGLRGPSTRDVAGEGVVGDGEGEGEGGSTDSKCRSRWKESLGKGEPKLKRIARDANLEVGGGRSDSGAEGKVTNTSRAAGRISGDGFGNGIAFEIVRPARLPTRKKTEQTEAQTPQQIPKQCCKQESC
jgi:hypothetical protein